jgi:regulatory protein
MKITAIKQQVKRPDRYSIFVEGKFVFGLSESALLQSKVYLGQEVDANEIESLKDGATLDKAYQASLGLIARRQRSHWEMETYLRRKGYEIELIEKVMKKLIAKGYVDDTAFAKAWLDNRRLLKHVSKQRLIQELRQKRVADSIIDTVVAADTEEDAHVLAALVLRKRQQSRYKDDTKLMQYLVRQGFRYDDVKSAVQDAISQQ